mmetsp:Transcript_42142/g.95116  ORF Transcript_42142/g.95116 Transcript_42142/m.95116 type:complete len:116 (-) Transcript_42142:113-460(-)
MDIMLTIQGKVNMGACIGCLFCPCMLGFFVYCCPLYFPSGMVGPLTDWYDKYPLIAVEVREGGPIKKEDSGKTVDLKVPVPSLEAINRRRGELGLQPFSTVEEAFATKHIGQLNP